MSKVLVLGGTGALGVYMVEELLKKGDEVYVVALDEMKSDNPNLKYVVADGMDIDFIENLLKTEKFDAVVDYMLYIGVDAFEKRYRMFLENTKHYIFLSTYRIYANSEGAITEESDRIYDVTTDMELKNSVDYCIYKAQQEDMLRNSEYNNFTIIRPSITYSKFRFQLVTLEAPTLIYRIKTGKKVILPEAAMDIPGTLTWSGDSAKMVASLILNPKAYGETYSISTSEWHTWREMAEIYKKITGMEYITVDTDTYVYMISKGYEWARRQLELDRLYNRRMDNSKILEISGLKQEDLMSVEEGLTKMFDELPEDWLPCDEGINERMDAYLEENGL